MPTSFFSSRLAGALLFPSSSSPAPTPTTASEGIFDGRRGVSEAFVLLSGDSRARDSLFLSLKSVPVRGMSVTRWLMPVSKKQGLEPDAAGFSVEVRLPSVFIFLL